MNEHTDSKSEPGDDQWGGKQSGFKKKGKQNKYQSGKTAGEFLEE